MWVFWMGFLKIYIYIYIYIGPKKHPNNLSILYNLGDRGFVVEDQPRLPAELPRRSTPLSQQTVSRQPYLR